MTTTICPHSPIMGGRPERFHKLAAYGNRMTSDHGPEMRGLRDAAQDQGDNLDPRWRSLAEGRLSEEEAAALKEEAYRTDEGRYLWDVYRPFDPDEEARVRAGVHERVRQDKRRRRVRRIVPALSAAAAAIAAAFAPLWFQGVGASFVGARGAEAGVTVLATPDAEFSVAIAPDRPAEIAVRGAILVRASDGSHRAWDVRPNPPSPDHVLHVAGTKRSVFPCVPAGVWDMLIAVGAPGEPLAEAQILGGSTRSYKVLRRRVVLEGPAVDARGDRCTESAP